MRPRSITAQLFMVIVSVIAVCWVAVIAIVLSLLSLNLESTWDEKLEAIATQILITIPAKSKFDRKAGPGLQLPDTFTNAREPLVFQIWIDRSMMVARTPGAPDSALQPSFAQGAATTVIKGEQWRVYTVTDKTGRVSVQVGNPQSVVDADMRHQAWHALALATLLVIVAGVVMWVVVRRSLQPVRALGRALRHRKQFDLTPLPLSKLPREIHVLVASFNHMLERLDAAIEGERRFIGDAAHELRTPLSALQAQAEIALSAEDVDSKNRALVKLLRVAKRSTRLSEQLLDLARLNAASSAPMHAITELSVLVQHVAQEFEVHASQNARALYLDIHSCSIACNVDEIGILLRNLVDNAMRYTPEGGNILVSCGYAADATRADGNQHTNDDRKVFLQVADDGPGVPESERDAIFVRFHRVAGTPVRGSGIGLSLVAGIVDLHHASIETGPGLSGRGFSVRIVFPAASGRASHV
ncbi:two-component system sensor protein [Xanthomonas arboricola pv. fragariae]|uniref:sensor histidine kinase n=1 Tax=Xanthomonas arboricola TaxID=56448 RepID=UPI000C8607D5|nr:ATP-binding protein [Xanthomonas arboricola]SOT95497.1 two-component system sensor protein [Xanthomonas arboricola pv. fragariae]